MNRLNQRECFDEVSLGWVEVFKGEGPEHRGQVVKENVNEGQESEWQDEHDDDSLGSLTLIERQQQWIDLGSYIIHKLRRCLRRRCVFNEQLVRENAGLRREVAALKGMVAVRKYAELHD
ncbi:hypothetical protein EV368DRAFT_69245 [Lentinula lateritia]|uniref:Uncharacterized protein n=1 Tax=Lentinula aff. lateritia TaxID=2804960 RepID=A0ACC1TKN2_9AGAR|nr:hypothetical protein F5876DRAFT_69941 [Lentinula aff. lateritia]KAJ3847270.1 hypothetical protein EV368DRAFT_69245 [Lentinula lateritia]